MTLHRNVDSDAAPTVTALAGQVAGISRATIGARKMIGIVERVTTAKAHRRQAPANRKRRTLPYFEA
jgi:hypothetical protein